jgi:hypothetical protein
MIPWGCGWVDEGLVTQHRCIPPMFVAPLHRVPRGLPPLVKGGSGGVVSEQPGTFLQMFW